MNKEYPEMTNTPEKMIAGIPRVNLGFFPTPLHRLDNLSEDLGVNLWIKRDDFTGRNQFGGNKTRKLEFLMGRALELGAESVVTYGATQSNHVMQTVWAAKRCGIKPIAYLAAMVKPDMDDLKGNMLLDSIYGAELHVVEPLEGESFEETEKRSFVMGAEKVAELNASGTPCYDIPMGGANEYGTLGYVNCMVELAQQLPEDFNPKYLYHATGSGGTMAGIAAGRKLMGLDFEVHSMMTLPMENTAGYAEAAAELANSALGLLGNSGQMPVVTGADFIVDNRHTGPDYEVPSEEGSEAIKLLARREGILVDPVYTRKAFAGMLADIRSGAVPQGSDILFLHTGGTTALFAEREILGDIF